MPVRLATIAKLVTRCVLLTAKSARSATWNSYRRTPLCVEVPFFTTSVGRYDPAAAPSAGESGVGAVMLAPLTDVGAGLSGALLLLQAAAAAQTAAMDRQKALTTMFSCSIRGIGHHMPALEYQKKKYGKCQFLRNNSWPGR